MKNSCQNEINGYKRLIRYYRLNKDEVAGSSLDKTLKEYLRLQNNKGENDEEISYKTVNTNK